MTVRELLKKDLPSWAQPKVKGHNLQVQGRTLGLIHVLVQKGWEACLYDGWVDFRKTVDGTTARTRLLTGLKGGGWKAFGEWFMIAPWGSTNWLTKVREI
jgi:hypothetical protein